MRVPEDPPGGDARSYGGRFFQWTPDDHPGPVVDVSDAAGWNDLGSFYVPHHEDHPEPPRGNTPFDRLREIADAHGVETVVVEQRYIDADFRSEHARFYAGTFRRYPSVCHRLHFFKERLDDLNDISAQAGSYVGYSVMRPLDRAPVGRTMIEPPPAMAETVFCTVEDAVHLYGTTLHVSAVPFMSQDEQFLRCAHAAEWMVAYHAHLRYETPRYLTGEIQEASTGGLVLGRQIPSQGLSVGQLLSGLHVLGFSTGRYKLPQDKRKSSQSGPRSLFAAICRYVNSEMPPIVVSDEHAWVVVGWGSDRTPAHHDDIVLFVHDDARGPYLRVDDPWNDVSERQPWRFILPPLPRKVFMTAERAEEIGRQWLKKAATKWPTSSLTEKLEGNQITFRTYAKLAHELKEQLADRYVPTDVASLYRFAMWPRYVWVVEALDEDLYENGQDSVLGEAILDATSHQFSEMYDRVLLALHVSGNAYVVTPDHEGTRVVQQPDFTPYRSGRPIPKL